MGWQLAGTLTSKANLPLAYGQDQYDLGQLEDQTRALVLQRNKEAETRSKKATVYNETWANRNGWFGTGTVSGNKYHAAGAASVAVVRPINLGPTEHLAARFKFRHNNTTGAFVFLGVTNTALGVAPTGGNDTKGVYYGISNTNAMAKFRGSEVIGTDPAHTVGALPAGDYIMDIVIDETWISWALKAPDYQSGGADFAYLRVRRAALPGGPTINNLSLTLGGTTATETGFAVHQGQIVRGANALDWDSLDALLDDSPVQYQIEDDTTSIRWSVQTPRKQKDAVPAPVVLFMHGAGENGRQPWTDAKTLTLTRALEAAGYIVCASDNGTAESGGALTDVNKFGNQASMDDYAKVIDYVRAHHSTGPVFLLGESMGTFSGLNLLQFRQLGGIAAFASICGQPDLSFAYADPTWQPEVTAAHAYPSADQAAWDAWMEDFNPRQQPGYEFRGVGIKFYVADDDATANPAVPGQWAAENAGWFDFEEYHTPTGGHMSPGAYQPADLVGFYDKHRKRWWVDDAETRQPILGQSKPDLLTGLAFPAYVAHRGGHMIHGEHSLEAYQWAADQGFIIEPDVQVLSDGGLACCHDATTTRTMQQIEGAAVSTVNLIKTSDWLRNYRVLPEVQGADYEKPALFTQVLDKFGGKTLIVPEIKVTPARVPVCDEIVKRGLERAVIVQSFDVNDCTYAVSRGIEALLLGATQTAAQLLAMGIKYVGLATSATTTYIDSLVAGGIKVFLYTINSRVQADSFVAANRAHGIFSDDPEWVSGRGAKSYTDPFRQRYPPQHLVVPTQVTTYFRENVIFKGGGLGNRIGALGNNSGFTCDWCPPIVSGKANIYFEIEYGDVSTAQTRWVGIFFGTTPTVDDPFVDSQAVVGQQGWHCLARRDGTLDIYQVVSNAAPAAAPAATLAGTTATTFAAAGKTGTHQFKFSRTATNVTLTNLTLGTTVTFANAVLNANARFQFNFNGTEALVRNVRVEEIP